MHQKINRYLRKYLGFKIVASGEGKLFRRKNPICKPLIIEFVGVPGVGKSTIYRKLLQRNRHLLSQKRHVLMFEDKVSATSLDSQKIYQELAENKMNTVFASELLSLDKMRILKYFQSVLLNDYICKQYNTQSTIISEEGLLHNFGTNIRSICNSHEIKSNPLFAHRAIIHCYSTAEQVANQIRKRYKETGKLVPQHKVEDFNELIKLQERALINQKENILFFENAGIPVLHINTYDVIYDNVEMINHFIKNLQLNSKSK